MLGWGYVVLDHYLNPNPLIAGCATIAYNDLVLGSIQLMVLGIVGEYMYKMFNEVKGRPFILFRKPVILKMAISKLLMESTHSKLGFLLLPTTWVLLNP